MNKEVSQVGTVTLFLKNLVGRDRHCHFCHLIFVYMTITLFFKSYCLFAAAAAKSLQSCPTLCDPIDCSPC